MDLDPAPGRSRCALLTGATGFLAPYVAHALRTAGWRVRAAVRQASPPGFDETAVVGQIGALTDWSAALQGVDTVVHLAALAHRRAAIQRTTQNEYFETNTAGTLRLAEQAAAAHISHFIFMSSIAVNGASTDGRGTFTETDEAAPSTIYGRTKADAEEGLRDIALQSGMPITVIRPPMVYGRNARGSFHALTRAIQVRAPLPFGLVNNRRAFVAGENVASFVAFRSNTSGLKGFETFIVADDEQVSTAEFVQHLAVALDRKALLLPIPVSMVRFGLRITGMADLIESTLGSLEVNTRKAHALGWRPAVTQQEGLLTAVGRVAPRL